MFIFHWSDIYLYVLASSCLGKSRGGLNGTRPGSSSLVAFVSLILQLWLLFPQPAVLAFVSLGLIEDTYSIVSGLMLWF